MKKTNNKGFSLVELIIVIAIMAILAGAIAPALIRYIDKSRRANDVSAAKTIKTAVETAMGNETTYEQLTAGSGTTFDIAQNATIAASAITNAGSLASSGAKEIFDNIGEKTPKIKYKKDNADKFIVSVTAGGSVQVWIAQSSVTAVPSSGTSANGVWQICPEIDDKYQ